MKGPIGVFDSGVGGLTVVRALRRAIPGCSVRYIADQAHVPYGGRPLEEVSEFARAICLHLAESGCRTIVMACNISSATALSSVRSELPNVSVFGMIGPAAKAAVQTSQNIAILATEGTVMSSAYPRAISEIDPRARVTQQACPKFVPLVESGDTATAEAYDAAVSALRSSVAAEARVIVLGCTHYPFLLDTLIRASSDLFAVIPRFLDPAEFVAREVALAARNSTGKLDPPHSADLDRTQDLFLTTGDPIRFAHQVRSMLDEPCSETSIGHLEWIEGRLALNQRVRQTA